MGKMIDRLEELVREYAVPLYVSSTMANIICWGLTANGVGHVVLFIVLGLGLCLASWSMCYALPEGTIPKKAVCFLDHLLFQTAIMLLMLVPDVGSERFEIAVTAIVVLTFALAILIHFWEKIFKTKE